MFSPNLGHRPPKLTEIHHFWSFHPKGKLIIEFLSSLSKITPSLEDVHLDCIRFPERGHVENISPDHSVRDRFMDANNERLLDFDVPTLSDLNGNTESKGLPPDFVSNFCLKRVFTNSWEAADLTHALTGLDYLTNLEGTRRATLRDTAERLRIKENNWQVVLADNREAKDWVANMQKQELKCDQCYSSLWVDLRVWIMAKELLSGHFYKPSVIAMLNTLFPFAAKDLPSLRISQRLLDLHRCCFYNYIDSIAFNGRSGFCPFIEKLNHDGTGHTWSDTRQTLTDYIKMADDMISESSRVHDISYFRNSLEVHPALRSSRTDEAESSQSNIISSSRQIAKYRKEMSKESDGKPDHEIIDLVKDSNTSGDTPRFAGSEYAIPTRSKIMVPKIRSQDEVDDLVQDPLQPDRRSNFRRSSMSSRSQETSLSDGRRLSGGSFPQPLTPSVDRKLVHRRSKSANKRTTYEFHTALPGTPELPSPEANEKQNDSRSRAASQSTVPSYEIAVINEQLVSEVPVVTKKRAFLEKLRWKKKPNNLIDSESTTHLIQQGNTRSDTSLSPDVFTGGKSQLHSKLSATKQATLKKKSSFGFLQRHKSQEDYRLLSDSSSDRTVTEATSQKVKPKRSLNNLFSKREMSGGLGILGGETSVSVANTTGAISGVFQTIRKARSLNSVRSSSSAYSNEGLKKTLSVGTSSANDEDRIITSADIDEPFPFGGFVQPQTPAALFEEPEEHQINEGIRQTMLEKARKERMAKWEQSEEFKRKLEESRRKRQLLREEMDANLEASKRSQQKQRVEDDTAKPRKASINAASQTPIARARGFEKPPKTPMKEQVLKMLADSYSPTSPALS